MRETRDPSRSPRSQTSPGLPRPKKHEPEPASGSLPRQCNPRRPKRLRSSSRLRSPRPPEQTWSAPTDEAIGPASGPGRAVAVCPGRRSSGACGRRAAWFAQIEKPRIAPAETTWSAGPTRPRSPNLGRRLRQCSSQHSRRWSHRRQHRNSGQAVNPRRWRSRRPWRSPRNQPSRRGMTLATKPRAARAAATPALTQPEEPEPPTAPEPTAPSAPPGKVVVSGQAPARSSRATALSDGTADDAGRPGRGLERLRSRPTRHADQ